MRPVAEIPLPPANPGTRIARPAPFDEAILDKRQTGSDYWVQVHLRVLPIEENKIRLYAAEDEPTQLYAPLVYEALTAVMSELKTEAIAVSGLHIELKEGYIHPVDFVPHRVKGFFQRFFAKLFRKGLEGEV